MDELIITDLAEKTKMHLALKQFTKLRELLSEMRAVDVAEMFRELGDSEIVVLFRLLPKDLSADVFVEMDTETCEKLINTFTDVELSEVLNDLYLDDTVDLIEEMPANVVKRIIAGSTPENRKTINRLLIYDPDSAGGIMTPEYVRFRSSITVEQALYHIRTTSHDKETVYTCFVTDEQRRLIGVVTARELLVSDLDARIIDIMNSSPVSVTTGESRLVASELLSKYGFLALPVVDNEMRLVGIITVDDAMDVIKEEAEDTISKLAAVTPTERPYLKTSTFDIWKARIPWLLLLMISATLSSTILSFFETALPAVLILFVPMLMDTGGNSGSQSSVTVIRALSAGEVTFKSIARVIWKELKVGILCGIMLGAVSFAKVMLVDRLIMNNPDVTLTVAFAVSFTLLLTVVIAKLIGSSLPILADRIGLDPAVMASPFITTIVDALALVVYFFIAGAILSGV